MNETLTLTAAGLAGAALGAVFFGGLWWTVRRGLTAAYPALLFLASSLLRMGLVLAGFYFVAGGQWKRLVMCLVGFIIARLVVMWLTRPPGKPQTRPNQEASHAP